MDRRATFLAALTVTLIASSCMAQTAELPHFRPLFNGKDLSGWINVNTADDTWSVRDGMIVCKGHPIGVMRSDRQYENFLLHIEWRHMEAGGNSGVFLWSTGTVPEGKRLPKGMETQMLELDWVNLHKRPDGTLPPIAYVQGELFGAGGLKAKPANPRGSRSKSLEHRCKGKGQWNVYDIVAVDGTVKLAINGKFVNSISESSVRKGYLCLESEGAEIHFRNIQILELPPGITTPENTAPIVSERARDMVFTKRYLNLPVKHGVAKRRMSVTIDGKVVREFEIELADGKPDFWAFLDISGFKGKQATVQVDALGHSSKGLTSIAQSDTIKGTQNLYKEKHRQQFHFSSRRGWNNDSNGLVFYKGEYHLYYQHNPYGWAWGNMHWAHAVSTDLVHWKELPIAIYPHQFGDWVFSGSAVVDWDNTAGFKTGAEDVIVAAYTSTGRGEAIAYSNDRGRTFTDYEGNPVVKHRGRDPKVIWYEPGQHWVMALYSEIDKKRTIAFYTSPDLKDWKYQSHIDGFYECPETFELPVDGNKSDTRWVVYAADGNYMIGTFDGKTFTPQSDKLQGNYGNCFYASQTYSDIPAEDGRRIQVAWGRIATPGMPFNQCMLFPCVLTLHTTAEGIRMFAEPIEGIERLHNKEHHWHNVTLKPGENILSKLSGDLFHIRATFDTKNAERIGFVIRGVEVVYDVGQEQLACLDKSAPLKAQDGQVHLELLVDRNSIEIFANGGHVYMPIGTLSADEAQSLQVFGRGQDPRLASLAVYKLDSAWTSGH